MVEPLAIAGDVSLIPAFFVVGLSGDTGLVAHPRRPPRLRAGRIDGRVVAAGVITVLEVGRARRRLITPSRRETDREP